MYNYTMKTATVDEIGLSTWRRLIDILDLSPENDWENIGNDQNKTFIFIFFIVFGIFLNSELFSSVLFACRHN